MENNSNINMQTIDSTSEQPIVPEGTPLDDHTSTQEHDTQSRVFSQITLKDVKKEMKAINTRVYKENRPSLHISDSYTNSMDIILTKKAEIEKYYCENMENISDNELIKIYDYFVTDGIKANEFFNATFTSIVITTINTTSIGHVIRKIMDNNFNTYEGFVKDSIGAIIILFVSLLFAWKAVKSLNRDSNKYEIKEITAFHKKLLEDELNNRITPVKALPSEWKLKEYKKRHKFLFYFPFNVIKPIGGFMTIIFHLFSKLNRDTARISYIKRQIDRLKVAYHETKHLHEYEKQPIVQDLNKRIEKEKAKLAKLCKGSDDTNEKGSQTSN